MRVLVYLILVCGLGGCSSVPPDCLGAICIGDRINPTTPPEIPGYSMVGGLCGDQTVLSSQGWLRGCDAGNAHAVIYQDRTHTYGLMLTEGAITSTTKSSRNAYP